VFTPQRWDVEAFIHGDLAKHHEDLELLIIDEALEDCTAAELERYRVVV